MNPITTLAVSVSCLAIPSAPLAKPEPTRAASTAQKLERRSVAILVHEGVELLDFAGPGEVLSIARGPDGRAFDVFLVAASRDPITSQGFVKIVPQKTFEDMPKPDIVVLPGGATGKALKSKATMAWVKKAVPQAEVTLTVCTGVALLAQAGLLDGLEATTHYGAIRRLTESAPKTKVHRRVRFVDNGGIVTTAGVSAGIDGSLHVIQRLLGQETAALAAKYMQYDWNPSGTKWIVTESGKKWRPRVPAPKPAEPDGHQYECPPCPYDCHDRTFDRPGRCPICGMKLRRVGTKK